MNKEISTHDITNDLLRFVVEGCVEVKRVVTVMSESQFSILTG